MKRVEIIANRSVEEDLMERLALAGLDGAYTKFPVVHGSGRQGRREGETVWPRGGPRPPPRGDQNLLPGLSPLIDGPGRPR